MPESNRSRTEKEPERPIKIKNTGAKKRSNIDTDDPCSRGGVRAKRTMNARPRMKARLPLKGNRCRTAGRCNFSLP